MKKVIWIIGGNAAGKTTQARMFHDTFGTEEKEIVNFNIDGIDSSLTYYGKTAHVGAIKDAQCSGTDTLGKKQQIELAFDQCIDIEGVDYVVLEPIMGSGSYIQMFRKFDVKIYIILLYYSTLEQNLERLQQRRSAKGRPLEEFRERTKHNVESKRKNFISLFNRVKDQCDASLKISATLSAEEIHHKIANFVYELDFQ